MIIEHHGAAARGGPIGVCAYAEIAWTAQAAAGQGSSKDEQGRSGQTTVPVTPKAQPHGRGTPYNHAMTVAQLDLSTGTQAPSRAGPSRTGSTLYLLWVAFWLMMIVIAVQEQSRHVAIRWWEPLLWEGSSAAAATLWLLVQRRAATRYARWLGHPLSWFGHHLKWLPLIVLTFVTAVYGFRHGVYTLLGSNYVHESWPQVFIYEAIKLSLFVSLWLGIIFGIDSFAQWQAQRQQLAQLRETVSQAQLAQLKAQLRPHFLFNALNTVSALMHVDVARADRLLARLGDLLRASLQAGEQDLTTLAQEIALLKLYAQVMQERFGTRVEVDWRLAEDTLSLAVPTLILQPLLENAYKHGVERSRGPVRIEIESVRKQSNLILTVRNTGPALEAECPEGVGLRNCKERLHVMYGSAATVQLVNDGGFVQARVVLPCQEHCP